MTAAAPPPTGNAHSLPIIRDTTGKLYAVRDAGADLEHVWIGSPVRKSGQSYIPTTLSREQLVRKAGCVVVRAASVAALGAEVAS